MSFPQTEREIKRTAAAARDGKLSLEELSGATFAITNGGVFGSLLSTPILNPPKTGILGMHASPGASRRRARKGRNPAHDVCHRLVDGKDSVSFLVRLKKLLEDPIQMILEI